MKHIAYNYRQKRMFNIPADTKLSQFESLLTEYLGGDDVVAMMQSHCKGLSYREIAEVYQLSTTTTYRLIRRAKQRMKLVGLTDTTATAPL